MSDVKELASCSGYVWFFVFLEVSASGASSTRAQRLHTVCLPHRGNVVQHREPSRGASPVSMSWVTYPWLWKVVSFGLVL